LKDKRKGSQLAARGERVGYNAGMVAFASTQIETAKRAVVPRADTRAGGSKSATVSFWSDGEDDITVSSLSTHELLGFYIQEQPEVASVDQRNQQYSVYCVTSSSAAITERYAYTGREWDGTVGLYHFRARWMSALTGRFLTRDPIGYKGRSLNLYQYVRSRSTRYLDPEGTQDGDVPVTQPYITYPGRTNCIGFCLHPEIDYVAPKTSIQEMLDHFKQKCDKSAGAAGDCLKKCGENLKGGGAGCNQLLIYVKDYGDEVTNRILALLQQLMNSQNQQDYEFLLNQLWAELNDRLGEKGGVGDDPLDIHMNRCDSGCNDEFIYQSGACKKDDPKRRVCQFFKPTPEKPEMIDPRRIVFKTCCCK